MGNNLKIAFYLRDKNAKNKTSILLSISNGDGQRDTISTGLRINPKLWNYERQTSTDKSIKDKINLLIEIIEAYEMDHIYVNKRDYNFNDLRELLLNNNTDIKKVNKSTDLFSVYISQYYEIHKNIKAFNTIKKYKVLERFIEIHYPNLRAKDINNEFADNLKAFYLSKKLLNNSINKNFQLIRVVLKWLFDNNKIVSFPLDKFKHSAEVKVEEIALEENEVKKIVDVDLSKNLNLDRIRDLFLLACYTGTDWADLHHLNKTNLLVSVEGHKYFKFNRAKTDSKQILSYPPCSPKVESILDKYNWNLEFISYDKSLQHLKSVCKLAGITEDVTLKSRSGSQIITETRKKCDWIAWKTGRRTFITSKLIDKVSTEAVSFAVGHTKITTTTKYHHASPDHMIDLLYK